MLIPGAGKRMAHEFEEYRPWKTWAQFDKEIGKYVNAQEVERLKQYTFIPLNLNTATEADFLTIPGVGKRMAARVRGVPPLEDAGAVREGNREVRERQRGRPPLALHGHPVNVERRRRGAPRLDATGRSRQRS